MRYMKAMIMAGIITAALVPALAVQATHTEIHGDVCGGSSLKADNGRYPASFAAANPAGKTGRFGVTQTAFEQNLLNGDAVRQNAYWNWDYLQGFDGIVFRIVEISEETGDQDGRDWQAGTVPETSTAPMTYDVRIRSELTGVPLDLSMAFYHVEFEDVDGDGIQDPDEPITLVEFLGSEGDFEDGATEERDRLSGAFPGRTTHFIVNLNQGTPRDNVMNGDENDLLQLDFMQTTVYATVTVDDPRGDLSCTDPVHARCLTDVTAGPENDPADPAANNPSAEEEERFGEYAGNDLSYYEKLTNCPSVSRLL